jgi:hypothetical protein
MRAQRIKCRRGALTAEGALIYDENVSGKRLDAPSLGSADGYVGSPQSTLSGARTTAK